MGKLRRGVVLVCPGGRFLSIPEPLPASKLAELLRWAASKGYTIQLHWNPDRTVHDLLDVVEDINKDYPLRDLRWTVLHLYNASEDNLKRMKALGLIWGVQDGPYFGGERLQRDEGAEKALGLPPIATALFLSRSLAVRRSPG